MSAYQMPLEFMANSRNGLLRHARADTPTGALDAWAIRRMLHGMHPISVAVAAGVSIRTAYRWRAEVIGLEEVTIGEHSATFVLRRDKPPMRLTVWRRRP